jgi:hypothetical protein
VKDRMLPAHYIAKANREKLGASGMDKIVAFDQSQSLDDLCRRRRRTGCERQVGTEW